MRSLPLLLALSFATASAPISAQTTLPAFPLQQNPLVLRQPALPSHTFSVTGERGAILGQQDGSFELWLLPVKLLHEAHLTARLKDYDVLIDLNAHAATLEVRPDHTTITYAHAAITVKQHMFIPHTAEPGLATAVVLFEIHATRPADITLSFAPSMEQQWPAPNFGRPGASWVPSGTGGAYLLDTDNPAFFGAVMMPNATHGLLMPYQERPETHPLEFHLSYDPARDDQSFYPLLCGIAQKGQTHADLLQHLVQANRNLPQTYAATSDYFAHFFDRRLTVTTPDPQLDQALRWAELSIESSKVAAANGSGLAGGWYTSGDSARPGFGWFFGRDTLWSLYAVNSFGDFDLSRHALDFLLSHQRADGKMMHEYSQTAPLVDWDHLPYLYASADSTPLFVMQMEDYVRASGDLPYLKAHWDNVQRAYAFTRSHTTQGVYDNTQGTGWVEEWAKPPHQEIYLAALDQQSAEAYSRLATLMDDPESSQKAATTAATIKQYLATYRSPEGTYRFSRNADGTFEEVPTIFPAVAWWNGHLTLPEADRTFEHWASHDFSTDWGIRSVPKTSSLYNPISYHIGSVWPLYSGWTSMAEYRTNRPLQAFANLRNTVQLTFLDDAGAITEVLSGDLFAPLGRSSSHQLWSSAMVLTPALRGLFGLETDALNHTLRIAPQLPATWDHASLQHVPVGPNLYDLTLQRTGPSLEVEVTSTTPTVLCLNISAPCTDKPTPHHHLSLPLPSVEVALNEPFPNPGDTTTQMKVLDLHRAPHHLTLKLEAPSGSTHTLTLRTNGVNRQAIKTTGATLEANQITVTFPTATTGYTTREIELSW